MGQFPSGSVVQRILHSYTTHTTELTASVSIHDSHYRAHHVCLHTRLTLPSSPRLSPYTTHTTELTTSVSIHDSHYRAHHVCLHTPLHLTSHPHPPLPDGSPPHSSFSRRHAPPPPPPLHETSLPCPSGRNRRDGQRNTKTSYVPSLPPVAVRGIPRGSTQTARTVQHPQSGSCRAT